MKLDLPTAISGLSDIAKLFKMDGKDLTSYAEAIVAACGWIDPWRWPEVCRRVLAECGHSRPKPSEFIAAHARLAEANAANVREAEPDRCAECLGTKFVPSWWRRKTDGSLCEAVIPCPKCAGTYRLLPDFQGGNPEGFERIEEREYAESIGGPYFERWKFGKGVGENLRAGNLNVNQVMQVYGYAPKARASDQRPKGEEAVPISELVPLVESE